MFGLILYLAKCEYDFILMKSQLLTPRWKRNALFLPHIYVRCKAHCERRISQGFPLIIEVTSLCE